MEGLIAKSTETLTPGCQLTPEKKKKTKNNQDPKHYTIKKASVSWNITSHKA